MLMSAFALSSCLFEEPELTDNGEIGIDPTETSIATDISLNLELPSATEGLDPFLQPATEGTDYRRRTVVAAIAEGMPTVSRTVLSDLSATDKNMSVYVNLRLHARKYNIVVWSDYVHENDGVVDYGYFYNLDQLPNVFMSTTYRGYNDFKDAASASAELDLTPYRNIRNQRVSLDLSLARPVARLQLVANDAARFLKKISSGEISGNSFCVRISYPGYLCTGYNISSDVLRHALMYMKFERTFNVSELSDNSDYLLAFDYLLADKDASTEIPVTVEILDRDKTIVLASTTFNSFCKAGTYNTVEYSFLTSKGGDGVDFDADFSGTGTLVIPATPSN